MPNKVYNNVEAHRVICDGRVVEDITSVTLPSPTHSSTSIDVTGMIAAVDMPDITHFETMSLSISHNNGLNCRYLSAPGKHVIEFRVVRQKYSVATGELEHESVKYRCVVVQKGTDKGNIERGNPLGSTENYSVLRFEEEINGEITTLIDSMAGIIKINGVDYTSPVESMLN